jgi:TusA-related sulfurtransferase
MADETAVATLITALAARDRGALESRFAEQATMRALLPRRVVDAAGPVAIAAEILSWFEDAPQIEPVHTEVGAVGDVWHAAFRFDLGGMDVPRVVEQHAYCTVTDGRIDRLRIICSGFRPARAPAPDQRIDALGDGCATLTPRIAAAMRALGPGEVLAVLTDDPSAPEGIAAWSRLTGHRVVASATESGGTRFYLRRKENS